MPLCQMSASKALTIVTTMVGPKPSAIVFLDHLSSSADNDSIKLATTSSLESVLVIHADDEEDGPLALTNDQACQIVNFALNVLDEDKTLFITCAGGISRSAAAAAAIAFGIEDTHFVKKIFHDPNKLPNKHVFDLVLRHVPCQAHTLYLQSCINILFETNRQLFDENHDLTV